MADDAKGDPDSNRLFARVLDKLDAVLFAHGMQFREDKDHGDFCDQFSALLFNFYDDLTGGDDSYDPDAPPDSTESDNSDDVTLDSEEEEEEEEVKPKVSKKKKAKTSE
jgi:hypothetical protein